MKYLNLWFLLIILFGVFAHSDLCSPSWLNNATGKEVKDLIEHGYDVDQICNNYNDRPIHLALMLAQNNLGVILSLVNANADLFAEKIRQDKRLFNLLKTTTTLQIMKWSKQEDSINPMSLLYKHTIKLKDNMAKRFLFGVVLNEKLKEGKFY